MKTYIANSKNYDFFYKFDLHKFVKYFIDDKKEIYKTIKKGNNTLTFYLFFK